MTDLWPQLEPLLAKVQKPARYIGLEDGSIRPEHGAGKVAWLLVYPDTYEIGLPNQGLQILYEILNERPDAVAERTYAPWVDLEAELRAVKPAVVVCLGATAAQSMLGASFKLMRQHGEVVASPLAARVVATIHPSAVLRAPDAEGRRAAYEMLVADLEIVKKLLPEP